MRIAILCLASRALHIYGRQENAEVSHNLVLIALYRRQVPRLYQVPQRTLRRYRFFEWAPFPDAHWYIGVARDLVEG